MQRIDRTRLEWRATSGHEDTDKIREVETKLRVTIAEDEFLKQIKAKEARALALFGIDAQLAEKRRRMAETSKDDARFHEILMLRTEMQREAEMERAKAAQALRNEIRDGMKQQMANREADRAVEIEMKDQEGLMMKRQLALMAAEDAAKARAEKQRRTKVMADVRVANAAALKMKKQRAAEEAHEDIRLAEMARIRARIEAEELRKREEARAAKAATFHALARQQRKLADRRGEEDEKRARRHREMKELADRRNAAAARAGRETAKIEMLRTLDAQIALKHKTLERERRQDRREQARAAIVADLALATEAQRLERKKADSLANARFVREQMSKRNLAGVDDRLQPFRERQQATIVHAARRNLLIEQQREAVSRLRKKGIPESFIRDVAKLDVSKHLHA